MIRENIGIIIINIILSITISQIIFYVETNKFLKIVDKQTEILMDDIKKFIIQIVKKR